MAFMGRQLQLDDIWKEIAIQREIIVHPTWALVNFRPSCDPE